MCLLRSLIVSDLGNCWSCICVCSLESGILSFIWFEYAQKGAGHFIPIF